MGWVSTFEDIEERRLENEVRRGFDDLITKAQRLSSLGELKREQGDFESLSRRIIEYLEGKKEEALSALSEALESFRKPDVRIISRLDKRERELKSVREKLHASEANLERWRVKGAELEARATTQAQENRRLPATIADLKNQLAWCEETRAVTPLRRR